MRKFLPGIIFGYILISGIQAQETNLLKNGNILSIPNFPSRYVDPRTILIWLPEDYSLENKYAVLYMQDGQMLFDSTTTWTGQEWKVDETMSRLGREKIIRQSIVVGIPNTGEYRWSEYVPQVILPEMPDDVRAAVTKYWLKDKPQSDAYLKFIVKELKPFIDSSYSTLPDVSHTFIMGSSMGGIISLYAICEYPDVFGGAGCLSTHWPLGVPGLTSPKSFYDMPSTFIRYLETHLPSPVNHRIYFDYGTETLDALYKPFQDRVDILMKQHGFTSGHWITREFPGEDHTEQAWARRLHIPLEFLLGIQ